MTHRPSSSGPEGENIESIASDLLGVHITGSESLDDAVEIEGLSLDDLGFGLPAIPESAPASPTPAAPTSEKGTQEDERQAELRALLSGGKRSESTAEPASEVPPRRPAPLWAMEEDEDDDFGAGLLSESKSKSPPPAAVRPVPAASDEGFEEDAEEDIEDELIDESAEEPVQEADDFGADILEERPRAKKGRRRERKPRREQPRSVTSQTAGERAVTDEDADEDVVDKGKSAAADEKDPYWDALENWDWNEGESAGRRGRSSGKRSEGTKPHGGRRGSKFDQRKEERPRRGQRDSADEIESPADTSSTYSPETSKDTGSSSEPKGRKGGRSRGRKGRAGDERVAESAARPGREKSERPPQHRRPEPAPPVADEEDEFDDDFGLGVLEAPAPIEDLEEEFETDSRAESEKRGRRRRRRGRRGSEKETSREAAGRAAEDLVEEPGEIEESGDDFGAGVISEEPRARRRPPRQEKAVRPTEQQPRREPREPQPAREQSRKDRQAPSRASSPASEADEDRYKGIPSWTEAIGYLARKPPSTRSSGDDRRQRSRGGRRGGGGSGGRSRR